MLLILTHGHTPDINILVASLSLGLFFFLAKRQQKVSIYWTLVPWSQTLCVCVHLHQSVYHPEQTCQKS